jgi:hypothetical protein
MMDAAQLFGHAVLLTRRAWRRSFFVCASDSPKTASHGRVEPDHKLFGPML